eukprot:TRINITY_DN16579_c0_g1_i2.p1 TRINITY_DN16579_c0_g1~~TRINITY_DN16579_c0_g1_i2.p1  ORF type:complete len:632 (-),score=120.66 TRINITY_DN16579_c0_g1_i2:30-1925(-)
MDTPTRKSYSPRRRDSRARDRVPPGRPRPTARSPTPPVRKDAFGRNTATRRQYGDTSVSPEARRPRGRRDSRSRSRRSRGGRKSRSRSRSFSGSGSFDDDLPMMAGFPGLPGAQAMWAAAAASAATAAAVKGGAFPFGAPGFNPMMAAAAMWGWPGGAGAGMQGGGTPGGSTSSRPRTNSGGQRKSKSRSRSGSNQSRGNHEETLRFPRNIMGRIIGKQGAHIKDVREKSGARVDAAEGDGDQCEFKVSGRPECVEVACRMLNDLGAHARGDAGRGPGRAYQGEDGITRSLEFPVGVMGTIIGSRGCKIIEVRNESGARVTVEKADDKCKVCIMGPPDAVEKAERMVEGLVDAHEEGGKPDADAQSGGGSSEIITDSLEFPGTAAGAIIGTRGAKIAEIRDKSGAKVTVEKMEDRCKVVITGLPAQIKAARDLVGNAVEEVMEVPLAMAGRVIGKGGETVQRIQNESGVRMNINARDRERDPVPVQLAGTYEAVQRARQMIADVVNRGGLPPKGGGKGGGKNKDGRPPHEDMSAMWNGAAHPPDAFGGFPAPGYDPMWAGAWGPGMPAPGMPAGAVMWAQMGAGFPGAWDSQPPAGDGVRRPDEYRESRRKSRKARAAADDGGDHIDPEDL